jgi:1,4-dihydroxy-6-naphthoate synthase
LSEFITGHAQEMDQAVMRQHIELYVNDFSLDLGEEGKRAVHTLYDSYKTTHPISVPAEELFVG